MHTCVVRNYLAMSLPIAVESKIFGRSPSHACGGRWQLAESTPNYALSAEHFKLSKSVVPKGPGVNQGEFCRYGIGVYLKNMPKLQMFRSELTAP